MFLDRRHLYCRRHFDQWDPITVTKIEGVCVGVTREAMLKNRPHNSTDPDDFDVVVTEMNHTGLCDFEICLYLEYSLPWLIFEPLVTQAKYLEPLIYCIEINYAFTMHATNVFGCFQFSSIS